MFAVEHMCLEIKLTEGMRMKQNINILASKTKTMS